MDTLILAKTAEQWVARACAKEEDSEREYGWSILEHAESWVIRAFGLKDKVYQCVRYLHVIDGVMYGTDSFRIHWATTKFPDGRYDPVTFLPTKREYDLPDFMAMKRFTHYESVQITELLNTPCAPYKNEPQYKCVWGHQVNAARILEALNGNIEGHLSYVDGQFHGVSEFGGFAVGGLPEGFGGE